MKYGLRSTAFAVLAVGWALTVGVRVPFALAQTANAERHVTTEAGGPTSTITRSKRTKSAASLAPADRDGSLAKRYFFEFRARNAASYGHLYVLYGEVNDRREIIRSQIAGFYPAGDRRDCLNCSVYNWTIGHVLPVPSEIGASDGDLEEQYVLARFRVWIDATQYQRLVAYIQQRKANKTYWNALFNNCVTFGRDVAVFMNLKVPGVISAAPSVMLYPETLVNMLREANGVEKPQAPLKDASGSLPTDIESGPKARPSGGLPRVEKSSHARSKPHQPIVSLQQQSTAVPNAIH